VTFDGTQDIYRAMHAGARGSILKDAAQARIARRPAIGQKLSSLKTMG
jgi:DNA-binding NarL/FixJ family response regulator